MDICLSDSWLTWHCWQKNFWSEPNLSGLVKRSKHPIKVDVPECCLEFMQSASPLQEWLDFVVDIFVEPPWFGSKSSEMSTQGSYVVDVKPQAMHMTSDRNMPENTLWAIQQFPLPAPQRNYCHPHIQYHIKCLNGKKKIISFYLKILVVNILSGDNIEYCSKVTNLLWYTNNNKTICG